MVTAQIMNPTTGTILNSTGTARLNACRIDVVVSREFYTIKLNSVAATMGRNALIYTTGNLLN